MPYGDLPQYELGLGLSDWIKPNVWRGYRLLSVRKRLTCVPNVLSVLARTTRKKKKVISSGTI